MPALQLDLAQQHWLSATRPHCLAITDGEINFLWSFIQGSIIVPEIWNRLLNDYGFCERRAWIYISIEMSFRDSYLLGPTILYGALIEKALDAVSVDRRVGVASAVRRLRAADTCFLCELNIKDASPGASPQARLDRGRDSGSLRSFASDLQPLWSSCVCTACKGLHEEVEAQNLCRLHLRAKARAQKPTDLLNLKDSLQELHGRITCCLRSFNVDGPKAGDREWAAFVAAIGWCGGWRPLLALLQ